MDQSSSSENKFSLIDLSPQALIQVALLGTGIGLLYWLITILVRQVVFVPLFCGDPASSMCVGATGGAGVVALIAVAIIGLLGLVRLAVYRPLLIVLATTISLWGIANWTASMFWLEGVAWTIVLFAFCYTVFTWLVRPRAFGIAIGMVVIVVLLARLIQVL